PGRGRAASVPAKARRRPRPRRSVRRLRPGEALQDRGQGRRTRRGGARRRGTRERAADARRPRPADRRRVTTATDAFARLHPSLQYHVVNTLGFRDLRPVQAATTGPVLDGENLVVLAPTAGGKTEASFFPLLSAILAEGRPAVSTLYVSPLRALLNNQEDRVERLCGMVGRRAFKWHGDVPARDRQELQKDPADVLLTTPESL